MPASIKNLKSKRFSRLYKCDVVWLSPYSPDKNKIEKSWANIKNWLPSNAQNFPTIQNAI